MLSSYHDFRLFYNQTIHPELLHLEHRRHRLLRLLGLSGLLSATTATGVGGGVATSACSGVVDMVSESSCLESKVLES